MSDENTSIHAVITTLYTALLKANTTEGEYGLLAIWTSLEYDNLANENKLDYHTYNYIDNLDQSIAAVAALLHHGLMLSFFVASGKTS
jgi:hypothetical protein